MISGFFKLILGFVLAIAVLLGSGLTIALYFVNRTALPPEKPMFANDNPQPKVDKPKVTPVKATSTSKPTPTSSPKPSPSPTPTPTPTESPDTLPPGAYQAIVTWPQGLSMRDQPASDAQSIGGVGGNQKVIILEESADKNWQKIRIAGTDKEGWVKAGNTKRVEE
ncbi:SH3 domain-containing protein [Sphaerospermopsis sp. LEGE 08334]|uniref:SH3 domain-containing protein n=1 Tax=Sphaerospermopsis sp. LEGE 08334 TaxID=1828651 RepID=UPI00187E13EE|nr:SH3 domain-containing protein [Sphaerospermopsis sp. LEGE 08334]MBE9058518.1 SH3 domain-containing protein [Sphaerospermopsis sp. LEGE 08334]